MGIADIIGYVASVLLAISLMVNNDLKFRWINSLGCLAFILYGTFITAFPVILTNSALLLINFIYLIRIYRTDVNFQLVEFNSSDAFVTEFFAFYEKDLHTYFPGINAAFSQKNDGIAFAVLRDMNIANVFIADKDAAGNAWVQLNYTVPKYRDFKVGRYLFNERKKYFIGKGISQIVYAEVPNKNHERFLKIMGFKKSSSPQIAYHFSLA